MGFGNATASLSPNCYSYVIGENYSLDPGEKSNTSIEITDVESVAKAVESDMKCYGYKIRRISGYDAEIYDNEYRIALRTGKWEGIERIGDYHFMIQVNTGQWAEKHGKEGNTILWGHGWNPENIYWLYVNRDGKKYYYDSEIIYFAISKN